MQNRLHVNHGTYIVSRNSQKNRSQHYSSQCYPKIVSFAYDVGALLVVVYSRLNGVRLRIITILSIIILSFHVFHVRYIQ